MDVQTASTFFALLALVCLAAVGVLVVAAALRAAGVGGSLEVALQELGRASVGLAWLVATGATLGSLYMSEVAHFTPCPLCWYQRICMYPLVIILGVATLRRDRQVWWYALPLAAVGAAFSAYHSWIQAFPPEGGSAFCTVDVPCTERYVWELGFVSIPFMALCGFLFVIAMMVLARAEPADEL